MSKEVSIKNVLVLFLLVFCNQNIFSQKWAWLTGGGGKYDQYIRAITTDTVGNIYATGFVNDTLNIQGTTLVMKFGGLFLAKFNSQGQLQYLKGFGSGSSTVGYGIKYDKQGYLYLSGTYYDGKITFGSLTLTTPNIGSTRSFLVKTNLNGNGVWGININEGASGALPLFLEYNAKDSIIAVAGHFNGVFKFYFGNDTFTGRGDNDIFLCTFNSYTGARKWAEVGGTISADQVHGLDFDPMGNFYMIMTIQKINSVDSFKSKHMKIPCTLGYDGAIVKFNKKGNVIWKKSVNGPSDQFIRAMKYGKDNKLYLSTYCSFAFTANVFGKSFKPSYGYETSLIKMDTAGNMLKKREEYTTLGSVDQIRSDNNSNYLYLLGSDAFLLDSVEVWSIYSRNFFLVKMDTSLYCSKGTVGGKSQTFGPVCLDVSPNGDCVIGGGADLFKDTAFRVAKFKYISKGSWEAFLCKYNFTDPCPKPKPKLRYTRVNKTLTFKDSGNVYTDERKWYFGDGQSDTSKSPIHTYTSAGVYVMRLIAESQCGRDSARDTLYLDCIAKAKFGYNVTGRKVQFFDSSSTYINRKWYFGDGQTDTSKQPNHQYINNGNYNVKLVLKGACRNDSIVKVVFVNCSLPSSGFSYNDTNRNVRFLNSSILALKRTWYFGDGQKDTSKNPIHTYAATSNYQVKIVSENVCGKDSVTKTINIKCPKPIIDFSYTASSDTISFSAFTSSLAVANWQYDFGDGNFASVKQIKHYYASKGIYTVRLYAANQCGKDTASHTIDLSCIIQAKFSYIITGNKAQFFDSSLNAKTRLWHFGDGYTDTSRNPVHTYADTGNFKVRLLSVNMCGKDSTEKIIRNDCNKPKSNFTVVINELAITITNTSSKAVKQVWRFGDGNSDTSRQPNHVYTKKGTYTVKLISENPCGKDSVEKQIQVDCKSPKVDFTYTIQNKKVSFASAYSVAPVKGWKWNFGDGNTDTASKPEHTYSKDSTYSVQLIGYNSCLNDTILKTVLVKTSYIEGHQPCKIFVFFNEISRSILILNNDCNKSTDNVQLCSISGQILIQENIVSSQEQMIINLQYLPDGIYFLRGIKGNSTQWVSKVVIY